jgi:plastocyanin
MRRAFLISIYSAVFLLPDLMVSGCSSPEEKTTPKSYTVEISQMKFQPAALTLQKGDTVVFINHDFVMHNVTEESFKRWTSPELAVGKSWSLVVQESANYYCTIHQVMKGKLLIK